MAIARALRASGRDFDERSSSADGSNPRADQPAFQGDLCACADGPFAQGRDRVSKKIAAALAGQLPRERRYSVARNSSGQSDANKQNARGLLDQTSIRSNKIYVVFMGTHKIVHRYFIRIAILVPRSYLMVLSYGFAQSQAAKVAVFKDGRQSSCEAAAK